MKHFLLLSLLALSTTLFSQLNSTLRSQLEYDVAVNDIWGYVAPDGTEYAIVGLQNAVSFVSLANPDSPVEVVRVPGDNSAWRDMKTFGEYAYNVADQGDEGISAFDLRFLPDSVPFKKTTYPNLIGNGLEFIQAHNLYIDTNHGRLYTAGGSRQINDGGILIFDLTADPMTPTYIGKGPATYSHDVYVVDDTLYCSEIYDGELAIYDITDLNNPITLGTVITPFSFTHNAWTTDDEQQIFTTDEKANAPVAAYDISDKSDIKKTFEFRPLGSINTATIPHNVHVINDYLSISYYTDGLIVADASKPDNIIEVANYDTWLGNNGGFSGDWGAYPFLPSGLTLVSDRQSGLYVIEVDYKRAARLEGIITDLDLGTPINGVSVSINSTQPNGVSTNATGTYKTGIANGGTFVVTFTAENYLPLTVTLDMANDLCLRLDTTMTSTVRRYDINVTVVDDETSEIIPNASFVFKSESTSIDMLTNEEGRVTIDNVFEGEYDLFIAEWGYQTIGEETISPSTLQDRVFRLTRGYMDDFVTDEGWTETNENATSGFWVRDVPEGTFFGGVPANPGFDAAGDFGREAYMTGNGGGGGGTDDVDSGTVTLTSPMFEDLGLADLKVSYQYWFANGGGDPPLNDNLTIKISNGRETVIAKTYEANGDASWIADSFLISDFVEITDSLQIIVETDDSGSGHIVEGAFDNFLVYGRTIPVSTENYETNGFTASVFPNPTSESFQLSFEGRTLNQATLRLTDAAGRIVSEQKVNGESVIFGQTLPIGAYFAEVFEGNTRVYSTKLVKQ